MKVLVVEDETDLSQSICDYLANEQFICEQAATYEAADEKISLYDYACIILDINLPDGSGLQLLEALRKVGKIDGVLIVSAKNSIDDKVFGLKAGADDYLTKPFHLSELSARVAAIIRRKSFDGKNIVDFDVIQINLNEKTVNVQGKKVDVTKKEYELLLYFIGNKGKVISKGAIAMHLWGDDMEMTNNYDFIYTHIKNLRRKLVQAGAPDYIQSVYGMGYKLAHSR